MTDNGYDERGSRPVWGTPDFLWKVTRGLWYGWPDFGMGPDAGNVARTAGFRVVRVEPDTGVIEEFAANDARRRARPRGSTAGVSPVAVGFSPDGSALYIVDFGVMTLGERGPEPLQETGVLWRVTREW